MAASSVNLGFAPPVTLVSVMTSSTTIVKQLLQERERRAHRCAADLIFLKLAELTPITRLRPSQAATAM